MSNFIDELLAKKAVFLEDKSTTNGVVISTRIRLARNLADFNFPGTANIEQLKSISQAVLATSVNNKIFGRYKVVQIDPETLDEVDKGILLERRLISKEFIQRKEGNLLLLKSNEQASIMVNEEDHLRIQVIKSGLNLEKAFEEIVQIDERLAKELPYAFSEKLGFLTSCPSNVGTGMRASVMVHLPGLVKDKQMDKVIRSLKNLQLAVRGFWGEGSENVGDFFQISNQVTLGESEEATLKHLTQTVEDLIEQELLARKNLVENNNNLILDAIGRAYGILNYCHILSYKEALELSSTLRLGVNLGFLETITLEDVNKFLLNMGQAYLTKKASTCNLGKIGCDVQRASLAREIFVK
jgi:protein arginine kinase